MLNLVRKRKERNIDRVRKMSVDEVADLLNGMTYYCPAYQNGSVYCDKTDCKPCIVEWLNSEVKHG
jgi:hypothetical protein